ncbi:MAG: Flp pilus assembly complex ATPase component TadA, partial [Gammaproteobacteria bacterium]|nr:Flp pilus assembly complex ATPase component TadA [Gammaproteobacteria bacterium]
MALSDDQLIEAGVRTGLIEAPMLETLRQKARRQRSSVMAMVLAHYRFPMSALYRAVAQQNGIDYINLSSERIDADMLKKIPASLIRRRLLLPLIYDGKTVLAVSDPTERAGIDSIQRMLGRSLPLVMTDKKALSLKINQVLPANSAEPTASTAEQDLVGLLDAILRDAYLNRSSDVHIITEEERLRVRFRVDGKLREYPVESDKSVAAGLISRIKVLSDLDIAEQRHPQDGGFSYHLSAPIDKEFSVRVATAPTRSGERVTMRLLGQESNDITLTELGMMEQDLQRFRKAIHNPYGMILLTGPTGSGKSTTLFAALQEINHPDINIMTVENPIEYVIEGVSQVQTGTKVTFAEALRS